MTLAELIFLIVALIGVIAGAVTFIDARLHPINKEIKQATELLNSIRIELFGYSGQNGLRSEIRELKEDVKALQQKPDDEEPDL